VKEKQSRESSSIRTCQNIPKVRLVSLLEEVQTGRAQSGVDHLRPRDLETGTLDVRVVPEQCRSANQHAVGDHVYVGRGARVSLDDLRDEGVPDDVGAESRVPVSELRVSADIPAKYTTTKLEFLKR